VPSKASFAFSASALSDSSTKPKPLFPITLADWTLPCELNKKTPSYLSP